VSATPGAGVPLRGDLRLKSRMEMLQASHLRAVAAAVGCTMASPDPDDGIDWVLTHTSSSHIVDCEVDLKVQLKSTSKAQPNPTSGYVAVSLSNEKFLQLAQSPATTKRILVAMIMPADVARWVTASHNEFLLRHCAYWLNMEGMNPNPGKASTTVHVPTANVFDDVALCSIFQRLGQGARP
jgi:Domain of unknown function (DUF4365)